MTLKRKITSLWINVAADVTESRCGGGDSPSEVRSSAAPQPASLHPESLSASWRTSVLEMKQHWTRPADLKMSGTVYCNMGNQQGVIRVGSDCSAGTGCTCWRGDGRDLNSQKIKPPSLTT